MPNKVDLAAQHIVDATMFWSPSSGGVRRYLLAKRAWLERHVAWRQTLVTPVATGPGTALVGGLPIPGSGGYRFPLDRRACAATMAALKPDLIEAGDPYRLAWSTLDAARLARVPSVAFCHSNLEAMALRAGSAFGRVGGRSAARAARAYTRHLYSRFDLVLAPSHAMRSHLLALGLANVERQALGVDTSQFNPALRDAAWRQQLCRSLELPDDTRLLLYVGRFAPEKNLDVLACAVKQLGASYALLAVGAGPTPPAGDRVRLRPYESDRGELARLLANVDVLVHAGDQETFGLSVLEAMASGIPVVARAADGLAELVDSSVGMGVDSPQAKAFAEAIEAVCGSDRSTAARRSQAARERACSYDWERIFPALFDRYSALIRGRSMQTTIPIDLDTKRRSSPVPPA